MNHESVVIFASFPQFSRLESTYMKWLPVYKIACWYHTSMCQILIYQILIKITEKQAIQYTSKLKCWLQSYTILQLFILSDNFYLYGIVYI